VPLLLAGVVAPALALTACASALPAGPGAQASPRPALAGTTPVTSSAARQVTLSVSDGWDANGRKPPAPAIVTGSVTASELAGLVTRQPPWPPGTYNCPDDEGSALTLTFRVHPGGPALATAVLALSGCEATELTVGGKDYSLGGPDSARQLAARVLEVAGVPWKLPPAQWSPGSAGTPT
jgi:hypothetical protein